MPAGKRAPSVMDGKFSFMPETWISAHKENTQLVNFLKTAMSIQAFNIQEYF